VTVKGRAGDTIIAKDEGPGKIKLQNSGVETGLQKRRHHHGGVQFIDQRRCCRNGVDA